MAEGSDGPGQQPEEHSGARDRQADERSGGGDRQGEERSGARDRQGDERSGARDRQAGERSGGRDRQGEERSGARDRQGEERSGARDRQGEERSGGRDRKAGESGGARPAFFRRPAVRVALIAGVLVLLIAGVLFWLHARRFESTDDAFIDARVVRLAPQISGRVMRVYVNDNQLVRAGETLVEIDPGDVRARLDQTVAQKVSAETEFQQAQTQIRSAEASYAQAQSAVTAAAAQARNAAQDLQRYRSLQQANPLAVAQQQLDQAATLAASTAAQEKSARDQARGAQAAVAAARAQAAGATARIRTLEAQVQQAQLNVGYTKVVSPIDGHVAQRKVAIGSYVDTGEQMLAIVPLQVWVTANFKETQLELMRPGQPVDIRIDACPGAEGSGHVDSIQRGAGQAFALLPPENATGNYVKVVQRVPVKIVFDRVPRDCPLGPGLSVVPRVTVR